MNKRSYHLLGRHANSLDGKLPAAHIEEILQIRAEQVNNEDIVQSFLAKVMYLRHTR